MMTLRQFIEGLGRIGTVALFVVAALPAIAMPSTVNGNATVKWRTNAIVKLTLTPNYFTGFGSVKAVVGTQPTPTHGPNAFLDGGSVDFGDIYSGESFLYKYAVHLSITTNSSTGFNLYGEGAADFYNQADASSQPISQTVYYLPSTSGSPADPNTGFSPAYPFQKTAGTVAGNSYSTPPTIAYSTYPAPIASSSAASEDLYYDYELKVPAAATSGNYYVWIVYTVVAK